MPYDIRGPKRDHNFDNHLHTKVRILFIIACGEELEAVEDLPGMLVRMEEILHGLEWRGLGLRVCLEGHGDLVCKLVTPISHRIHPAIPIIDPPTKSL